MKTIFLFLPLILAACGKMERADDTSTLPPSRKVTATPPEPTATPKPPFDSPLNRPAYNRTGRR